MVTMVKGKVKEQASEAEQVRPVPSGLSAARREPTAPWVPATQNAGRQSGIIGGLISLLTALDRTLAGPPMTARERIRRQAAEAQTEREFGLLPH